MSIRRNELLVGVLSFLLLAQIGTFGIFSSANAQSEVTVPEWIKDLAKFWSDENISDKEFAAAIEYLIESKIIASKRLLIVEESDANTQDPIQDIVIPDYVRNNAKWFYEETIGDSDFVLGLEYMVENKIIQSPRIKIVEIEVESDPSTSEFTNFSVVSDSDGDGILDDVDDCQNQAEVINGFEDSDGCPDEVPVSDETPIPDKSLTISDVEISPPENHGWGTPQIKLSWIYYVEHTDESGVGFPIDGHFVIEITGTETINEIATYAGPNKFAGDITRLDPGADGGILTFKVISFIGDDRGNYIGDGDQREIIIPPYRP